MKMLLIIGRRQLIMALMEVIHLVMPKNEFHCHGISTLIFWKILAYQDSDVRKKLGKALFKKSLLVKTAFWDLVGCETVGRYGEKLLGISENQLQKAFWRSKILN